MFKKIIINMLVVVSVGAFMLGQASLVIADSPNNRVVIAQNTSKTSGSSTAPVIKTPEIYKYKSELLPGPKTATFRDYFVDTLLPRATRLLISLTAAASVLFIIYGGYRMLFYVGTQENLEAAKNIITWAVVGLLISIFAFFIVSVVSNVSFLS